MQNLTDIRKFLLSAYYHESASQTEVHNFLRNLLKYVFNFHNIEGNDYEVVFKHIQNKSTDDYEAKIIRYYNHPKKFDILLNSKFKSYKYQTNDDASNFFSFIYFILHELGHIIQNIEDPEKSEQNDDFLELLEFAPDIISDYSTSKEKRLIIKALKKYLNAQEFMSYIERDANKKAYIYFVSILENLIGMEQDDEFADFLCSLRTFLEQIKKDNYSLYKQYGQENQEAIQRLEELNFEDELFLSVSTMLKSN